MRENRKAWMSPPEYVKATAAYQFDDGTSDQLGSEYGSWVHVVEQFYVTTLRI